MDDELCAYRAQYEPSAHKVRVGEVAARQCGRVTHAQLGALGVPPSTVRRWVGTGYLIRVLPRVYAVGHAVDDERTRLFALVLFAGPNAALSHGTAAHWRGWLRYPVGSTHVSTPRQLRSRIRGVTFHPRRELDRQLVNGIPCTTAIQTLFDIAATEPLKLVKRSLAQLDYERRLDAGEIRAACGRGRPGSAALLAALDSYIPQLARTRSDWRTIFCTSVSASGSRCRI